MSSEKPSQSCERLVPEEGPILLWPNSPGEERWGLLLDVNVCPFPGCPERQVIVDGFLVENLRRTTVRPGWRGAPDDDEPETDPDWAFVASVEVDSPGEAHIEKCRDSVAFRWFTEALDTELRAALLRRFERQRAEFDAVLRKGDAAPQDGSTFAATYGRNGWSTVPVAPDRLDEILAGLDRGTRDRERLRREPLRRGPLRAPRVGRNDPCPCGSGRKYKKCCLGSA